MDRIEWGAGTPGPWKAEEGHIQRDSGGIRYWQIDAKSDAVCCNQFCYAGHDPIVNAANARAIAEVPAMVMILRGFRDRGTRIHFGLDEVDDILARIDGGSNG